MADPSAGLREVFEFIASSRPDVKKMALQGLAQHSKDSVELQSFISDVREEPHVVQLLNLLSVKEFLVLGDVLTVLTNVSVSAMCSEVLAKLQIIPRCMRLLDSLNASDGLPSAVLLACKELTLMLLNNLTAAHAAAVDRLLQVADEDLEGFYLSRLMTLYEHEPADSPRDLRRWIVQVILNVTRTPTGQRCVTSSEEWMRLLAQILLSPSDKGSLVAAQCLRNCSALASTHANICRVDVLKVGIAVLCEGKERSEEVQLAVAEFFAAMLTSEAGMQAMEELNAKRHLSEAVGSGSVTARTKEFVEQHILPFLDDIQDAYVQEG